MIQNHYLHLSIERRAVVERHGRHPWARDPHAPSRVRRIAAVIVSEVKRMHNQSSAEWAQYMEQRHR